MNIFAGLKFEPLWNATNKRSLTREEKDIVESAEVVESDFGLSVCFHMKDGETSKIPLTSDSKAKVGDMVDIDTLSIITLRNDYGEEIHRIEL